MAHESSGGAAGPRWPVGAAPRGDGGYMPQLDGLRAIAILVVVLHHYDLPGGSGWIGVHLFFVLSGFLITGILVKAKTAVLAGASDWLFALRQFYVRRCLRIFPLYYVVVLAAIIVGAEYARAYAPWLLTYMINFKFADQGWFIKNFAHFWSLAVEEQYYLVWPWVVLLIPMRWLRWAAWAMVAVGPLYRLGRIVAWQFFDGPTPVLHTYVSTFAVLDSIGFGSLIAIAVHETSAPVVRQQLAIYGWVIAAPLLLGLEWLSRQSQTGRDAQTVFEDLLYALPLGWCVLAAAIGFRGIGGRVLAAPPVVFIGKISYGLYVFHPIVRNMVIELSRRWELALPESNGARAAVFATCTLAVATVSWYGLERPLNNLKQRFSYGRGKTVDGRSVDRGVSTERAASARQGTSPGDKSSF